jgi:hypothetical protein
MYIYPVLLTEVKMYMSIYPILLTEVKMLLLTYLLLLDNSIDMAFDTL